MTTIASIKGYINGEEWGVYEPAPELMTAQEILTAAQNEGYNWTNLISDLNEYAEDYYNICDDANLTFITYDLVNKCLDETGTHYSSPLETSIYYISYNSNTKTRSVYRYQGSPK